MMSAGSFAPFLIDNPSNFDEVIDLFGSKVFVGIDRFRRLFDASCGRRMRARQGAHSSRILEDASQCGDKTVDRAARQWLACGLGRFAVYAGFEFTPRD